MSPLRRRVDLQAAVAAFASVAELIDAEYDGHSVEEAAPGIASQHAEWAVDLLQEEFGQDGIPPPARPQLLEAVRSAIGAGAPDVRCKPARRSIPSTELL